MIIIIPWYPSLFKLPLTLWNSFTQRFAKTQQIHSTQTENLSSYAQKRLSSPVPGDTSSLTRSLDVICARWLL